MQKLMPYWPVVAVLLAAIAAFYDLKTDVEVLRVKVAVLETHDRVVAAVERGDLASAQRVIDASPAPPAQLRPLQRILTNARRDADGIPDVRVPVLTSPLKRPLPMHIAPLPHYPENSDGR